MHLNGVDVDGLEFSSSEFSGSWPGSLLSVAQMAVTGWNSTIIRLPLNQDFWFGCGGAVTSTYQGIVQSIVNYCSANNVYVLIDLHWSGESSSPTAPCGAGWGNDHGTAQQPMADANAITFWSSVAGQTWTNNNPAVLFDLYNEPYDMGNDNPGSDDSSGYNVWLKGGVLNGASFSTPGMQALLNAVRSTGANNLCLMGGLHWCANLAGLPAGSVTNLGNGVLYAAHIYGSNDGFDTGSWNTDVPSSILANYPVFVGEYGPDEVCSPPDTGIFDSPFFAWMAGTSGIVGGTAWSMTSNSCPNLYTDSPSNFTPNAWGTDVKNWLANPPSSGCPPTPTFTYTPARTGWDTLALPPLPLP